MSTSSSRPTLYDLLLPGTHDSAAYRTRPDLTSRSTPLPLLFPPIRRLVTSVQTDFALTQSLSILEQLRAGARLLDIRVTKRPTSTGDTSFWTHHGMVLCVPLTSIIDQINTFHAENTNPVTVITVFRASLLSELEQLELTAEILAGLHHDVYNGDPAGLRTIPIDQLPHNIVAGIKGGGLSVAWGKDAWLDTFDAKKKISFLDYTMHTICPKDKRDDLFVAGWTVTPHLWDVVWRVLSLGLMSPGIRGEAEKMNDRFEAWLEERADHIRLKVNVVFFDYFNTKLGKMVNNLKNVGGSDTDDSANS